MLGVALTMLIGGTSAHGGSSGTPFRGTLMGTAGIGGQVTLSRNGVRVASLKSGRYRVVINDTSPHNGFVFDRPNLTQIVVTTHPFIGRRTKTVTLTPGRWDFHGALGALHEFTVR